MKQLYFVRHGQSQANVDGVFGGHMDTPLTELGRKQAEAAGHQAQKLPIDHIITSPLSRAHDTAHIIAETIGFPADKIEQNSLLLERSWGSAEGLSWATDLNMDGFADIETVDSVMERAKLLYEHVLALPYDTVLLVGHGSFGNAFKSVVSGQSHDDSQRIENATIIKLL